MNNVRFEAADAIAVVTIDRPKAMNALNTETLHELNACFREIRERKDIRGGCELAMACDIRIASEKARFGQPEVGLGVIPGFGGTQRLARLVGRGRAKELIFTGTAIDAQEAYRIGLVNHVVPAGELMAACRKMAETIRSKSGYAVSLAKDLIDRGMEMDLEGALAMEAVSLGLSFASHDKAEGMAAFLEKRPAHLTDF